MMSGKYCHVCGEYGHYPRECPKVASPAESTGGVMKDFEGRTVWHLPPPPHEHTPAICLNPSMQCEDCDWRAGGSEGWIACQALEHVTHHPGHRVTHHPAFADVFVREGQLPTSAWRSQE